jgi:hypothetical protein
MPQNLTNLNTSSSTMSKNIIVLFPPGTGGNHLANLLSTDSTFQSRASLNDYKTNQSANAHFSYIKNLDRDIIMNLDANLNHVLCGHWGEYYWLKINHLLDRIKDRQILILTVPNRDSISFKRFIKHNQNIPEYLVQEQRSLYSIDVVRSVFNDDDFFVLDPDILFSTSLTDFFSFVVDEMALTLDYEFCNEAHQLWYKKIKGDIAN